MDQLTEKENLLKKNVDKQKGLYELFAEDKINLELYKDKAEALRQEEKRFKQDIRDVQIKIIDRRNSMNIVRAVQDFLLRLRADPSDDEGRSFLMKTFMRIIFKEIKIQDREIVKFELNEPWKMCYEEGTKWMQMREIEKIPTGPQGANPVCFWLRLAAR